MEELKDKVMSYLEAVSLSTPTGKERLLAERLEEILKRLGFQVKRQVIEGDLNARFNLLALRGEPEILIATHIDTVPSWGHVVFKGLEVREGHVYLRGALDTKGQIAALLTALELSKGAVALAFFVDEEKEGKGSETFMKRGMEEYVDLGKLKGAVVLEPSQLKLGVNQWGNLELELWSTGEQAHGASLKGINAVHLLLKALRDLEEIAERYGLVFNIGRIEGGIDPQTIPDVAFAQLDFLFPVELRDRYEEIVHEVLASLSREEISYRVISADPPFKGDEHKLAPLISTLKDIYQKLDLSLELVDYPAWTDAQHLHELGIPTVILGAGDLGLAHTRWERVSLNELVSLALILKELIETSHP